MAITINTTDYLIESNTDILDLLVFHNSLRDWEDSPTGMIYPITHKWKALDLGSGAFFYQADIQAPWRLKFTSPGNYKINGNLNAEIIQDNGVYVERKTSAAYVTTSIGGSGPSAEDIANAVLSAIRAATPPIPVNTEQMNGVDIIGDGSAGNKWRGANV